MTNKKHIGAIGLIEVMLTLVVFVAIGLAVIHYYNSAAMQQRVNVAMEQIIAIRQGADNFVKSGQWTPDANNLQVPLSKLVDAGLLAEKNILNPWGQANQLLIGGGSGAAASIIVPGLPYAACEVLTERIRNRASVGVYSIDSGSCGCAKHLDNCVRVDYVLE